MKNKKTNQNKKRNDPFWVVFFSPKTDCVVTNGKKIANNTHKNRMRRKRPRNIFPFGLTEQSWGVLWKPALIQSFMYHQNFIMPT